MTPKQRQKWIKTRQLMDFRRFIRLDGLGDLVFDYLGVNVWELRAYIEKQWMDGMNWENYGEYWVVDHIVPLKFFDLRSPKEMKIVWNYQNLKPSYYWDNHAKGYCPEVTYKILDSLTKSSIVSILKNKVNPHVNMFEKYY